MTDTPHHSDKVLDTIETFLDTHPELEDVDLSFEERTTGENHTVRMEHVRIGGETYLVVVKRVGG